MVEDVSDQTAWQAAAWSEVAARRRTEESVRRSARAVSAIGCDFRCQPARVWFRRSSPKVHTDACVARGLLVARIELAAASIGDGGDLRAARDLIRSATTEMLKVHGI